MPVRHILAIAFIALSTAAAFAQEQKIAFVELDRVFNDFYKTKLADAQLKEQAETYKVDRKAIIEGFQELQDEFDDLREQAQNKGLTEDVRAEKRAAAEEKLVEIREQESKIRRYDESRQKQLDEQTRRMRNRIVDEIREVVQIYARGESLLTVIDSSSESHSGVDVIVYADAKFDITQAIIDTLNKGRPADAPTALPAPKASLETP